MVRRLQRGKFESKLQGLLDGYVTVEAGTSVLGSTRVAPGSSRDHVSCGPLGSAGRLLIPGWTDAPSILLLSPAALWDGFEDL